MNNKNSKKTVLSGHKKVGSKFIPPFAQIGQFSEISYINVVLPEIIWMGLVQDTLGVRGCVDLCADFVQILIKSILPWQVRLRN